MKQRLPLMHGAFLTAFLMFTFACLPGAIAQSLMNQVDVKEHQGSLYLYLHTDAPVLHKSMVSNHHKKIQIDLEDVELTGDTLKINYENAPNVQSIQVQQLGEGKLRLHLQGKRLSDPIIGFRELGNGSPKVSVVKANTTDLQEQHSPPAQAMTAIAQQQTPIAENSNAALDSDKAIMAPLAIESSALQESRLGASKPEGSTEPVQTKKSPDKSTEAEAEAELELLNKAVDTVLPLAERVLKWVFAHAGEVAATGLILVGLSYLVYKIRSLQAARPEATGNYATSPFHFANVATNAEASATSGASTPAFPVKPVQAKTEERLSRIRQKMQADGFASAPELPSPEAQQAMEQGINLKVREAIARKQAKRYGKAFKQVPLTKAEKTVAEAPITPNSSLGGNKFLHEMAQYMDVSAKERIAKAIEQNKPIL